MINNRGISNSPRLKELKRKQQVILRNKILISLFSVLILLIGLSYLSKWQKLNIENVEIIGNKVVDTELIDQVAREDISGRYLWLFPKTNFLLYPKNKIKDDLAKKFTRLKDISLKINNTNTLEISVSERTAAYTWCGDRPADNTGPEFIYKEDKCYFTDNTGYIFDTAPYFSGEVYLRFFGKITDSKNSPLGVYFLKGNFERLVSFIENLTKIGLKPAYLLITEDHVELYLSSGKNSPKIILKLDSDLNKITENLQTALETEPLKSDFKKKFNSLLYIDLRFGNKVYYKFK